MIHISNINLKNILWLSLIGLLIVGGEIALGLTTIASPGLAFLTLISIIIGITTCINPDLGIAILILVLPFSAQFTLDLSSQYAISMVTCQIFFLLFVRLFYFAINKNEKLHGTSFDGQIFLFIIWVCAGLLWTPSISLAGLHIFSIISVFLILYVMVNSVHTEKSFYRLIWAWWFMSIMMGIIGVAQFFGVPIGTFQEDTRVAGFSGIGNEFARLMMVSAFLLLGLFRSLEKKQLKERFFVAIGIFISLISMLFALSRTSLVGALIAFFIFGLRSKNRSFSIMGVFIPIAGFMVLLIIIMSLSADITSRIETMANFTQEYSWQSRMVIWAICWLIFIKTYGLGVGAGGIEAQFDKYAYMFITGQQKLQVPPNAHSVYLDVLTHFGVIGLAIFLWMIIKLWHRLAKAQRDLGFTKYGEILWGINCGLISLMIQSLIASVFHTFTLWAFIGLAIVTAQIGYKQLGKTEEIK